MQFEAVHSLLRWLLNGICQFLYARHVLCSRRLSQCVLCVCCADFQPGGALPYGPSAIPVGEEFECYTSKVRRALPFALHCDTTTIKVVKKGVAPGGYNCWPADHLLSPIGAAHEARESLSYCTVQHVGSSA